jgi:hypothetical protein
MAKGQQRSNREPKKPKKDKSRNPRTSPASVWTTVDKIRQGAGKK